MEECLKQFETDYPTLCLLVSDFAVVAGVSDSRTETGVLQVDRNHEQFSGVF